MLDIKVERREKWFERVGREGDGDRGRERGEGREEREGGRGREGEGGREEGVH